jgi:predicted RecB family endonuclease
MPRHAKTSKRAKKAANTRWERSRQRTEEDEPVGVVNDLTPPTPSLSAFNQDVAIDSIEEMRVDLPKIYTQSDMDKVATSLIARSTDLEEEYINKLFGENCILSQKMPKFKAYKLQEIVQNF